jgi:hypothetical protein
MKAAVVLIDLPVGRFARGWNLALISIAVAELAAPNARARP